MTTDRGPKMQALQNEILEAVATGVPFEVVADLLCRRAESLANGARCSILSVDAEGRLGVVVAPSLPKGYAEAVEGVAIGPMSGTNGAAAFHGQPIETIDISRSTIWASHAADAASLGLKASWACPIKASDGRVKATFSFYFATRRRPTAAERHIAAICVHLCSIMIEQRDVQSRNHLLAYHDQLTGLRNRHCFDEMLAGWLARHAAPFGLLLIDVDHLKAVNDTLGHSAGDALLKTVAERLPVAADQAFAFRLGGDEFAILSAATPDRSSLEALAREVIAAMSGAFCREGGGPVPQVTIGGVVSGADGSDSESLRQNADFALYHAKENNRGGHILFEPSLRTAIVSRLETIRAVDAALAEDRILTFYQPVVRLDNAEIVGLEALSRMRDHDGRIVTAGEFATAFADPNLAIRLTERMLRQVAVDVRAWLDAGIPFQHVGVNLSMADFQRPNLADRLAGFFEKAGVPLRHLVLEVTESVFVDGPDRRVATAVDTLRRRGMMVALDDFGTGFASLTHLLTFPVDVIKIDRCFVDRMLTDERSAAIVETLIALAHRLNMRTVAEGVETLEQAERLRDMGCVLGQGFHFARPASFDITSRMLRLFSQRRVVEGGENSSAAAAG